MEKFIVSDWFERRAALAIQLFEVENIEFQIMKLDDDLIAQVEGCETYHDMLKTAANSGISYNRKRVADDSELSKDLDLLWGQASFDIDSDPCVQYRVGDKICEISGLSEVIANKLKEEEAAEAAAWAAEEAAEEAAEAKTRIVDGDKLPGEDVTMGQLENDALAHEAVNNL